MVDNERRREERIKGILFGTIEKNNSECYVNVVNINLTGAQILTNTELVPGSKTKITVQLSDRISLVLKCIIVWVSSYKTSYYSGILFENPDKEEMKNKFLQAELPMPRNVASSESKRKETYEIIFESYHDEIFLRRVWEFIDYIKDSDPGSYPWAQKEYNKLKVVVEEVKSNFRNWANRP